MVEITVNMRRYFELLNLADSLGNEGDLSKADFLELLDSQVIFSDQYRFSKRQNYLELIQDYWDKKEKNKC